MLEKVENELDRPIIHQNPEELITKSRILFRDGILGFPEITRYLLIESLQEQPFFRLQADGEADLVFTVIDPALVDSDYQPNFSRSDLDGLAITDSESMLLLSIVSIPKADPLKMTANLMSPLVINARLREGRQIVLSNSDYSVRE